MKWFHIVAESAQCRYEGSVRASDEGFARDMFMRDHPEVEVIVSASEVGDTDSPPDFKTEARAMVDRELLEAIYVMLRAR